MKKKLFIISIYCAFFLGNPVNAAAPLQAGSYINSCKECNITVHPSTGDSSLNCNCKTGSVDWARHSI